MLARSNTTNAYTISRSELLRRIKMVNDNYRYFRNRRNMLSNSTDIKVEEINDFYDLSYGTFKSNIETALKRLERKSLIFVKNEMTVCYIEDNTQNRQDVLNSSNTITHYRNATDIEIERIQAIERTVMKNNFNCDDKQYIYKRGLETVRKFNKIVNEITYKKLHILYFYKSYKLIFNHDNITKKLEDLLLSDVMQQCHQYELNYGIQEKLLTNAINRHDKAELDVLMDNKDNIKLIRSSEKYVNNTKKLNELLIDIDTKFWLNKHYN